ncbi:hypothetical protein A2U01_0086581 [Trifolium medium]|uniref:Uncharacterized protein n=1 Tax=Trifolium medium TaxID=97028 RepID=A0A392TVZ1_9FABA|nr:hypothetical protein [Trifolium medium]
MPRSASIWRPKADKFRVTGEKQRELATRSLSDATPRSATQAHKLGPSHENGPNHAQISFSPLLIHGNNIYQAQATL